jgi:hypothetical protein
VVIPCTVYSPTVVPVSSPTVNPLRNAQVASIAASGAEGFERYTVCKIVAVSRIPPQGTVAHRNMMRIVPDTEARPGFPGVPCVSFEETFKKVEGFKCWKLQVVPSACTDAFLLGSLESVPGEGQAVGARAPNLAVTDATAATSQ